MTSCDTVPRSLLATNVYFLKCCLYTLLIVSTIIVSWSVSYKQEEHYGNTHEMIEICTNSTQSEITSFYSRHITVHSETVTFRKLHWTEQCSFKILKHVHKSIKH